MDHPEPVSPSAVAPRRLAVASALALLAGGLAWWIWNAAWFGDERVAHALAGGCVAAGATALGAVPVLLSQRLSDRAQDGLFGFGAGVMLAASSFSLVIPGLEAARGLGAGPWRAGLTLGAAILLGALMLLLMERYLPHEHFIKGAEGRTPAALRAIRRTWLFVFAIALHNLPEGLAIGVGYAGNDPLRASALMTGISIQDIPEGLVVAVALIAIGYGRVRAVLLAAATGLVEPLGAVAGAAVLSYSASLLPWGLGFAAGAMLFVISNEIIPESHRKGHEAYATGGLMIGFVLMMLLDTALG
ncbi:ZIP family metal transporter [Pigmentiphaga soli]|uniref:ZIP family metal transporter n=1 Tax=Pigmentiphaga soli TaxID=1007095 RepID=A0ABP8HM96_9BURK